jgi:WD40-like Beta Propeller Repeat
MGLMCVRGFALRVSLSLCVVLGALGLWSAAVLASGGPGLIDGRGWEMVSPLEKQGAAVEPLNEGLIQASEDGSAIAYYTRGPIVANAPGHSFETPVLSRRGSAGWSTQELATPHEEVIIAAGPSGAGDYKLFTPDLSVGLLEPLGNTPLPPLPAGAEKTLYLRNMATGSYLPLVTAANVPPGAKIGEEEHGQIVFRSASPDLSHVVFSSPEALTANAFKGGGDQSLYEWAGGRLQLVSVLPRNGEGKENPASEEGAQAKLGWEERLVRHAVSDDGSLVVWQAQAGETRHLYLRDTARGETIQLDAVQSGEGKGTVEPRFQTASSDGSRIFFTDTQALTASADGIEGYSWGDLYVFEVSAGAGPLSGTLRDLTLDRNAGEKAEVLGGVPGASEDGSYVYFVANGALAPNSVHGTCENFEVAEPKERCNLYVEHRGTGGWEEPKLVAVISGEDRTTWANGGFRVGANFAVRVSPDGRYLAFMTGLSVTGYDNRDAVSGVPDKEVYLYDAGAGRVVCASCDPTGVRPTGMFDTSLLLVDRPGTFSQRWLAGSIPSWTLSRNDYEAFYQSRFLGDGGRLFFQSPVALVPGDVNGREDVYEFEPLGVGGCQTTTRGSRVVFSEASGGCVGLISSGTSEEESAFVDASASGGDVFFVTSEGLVPQDGDGAFDMYDAHECTGASPCLSPAAASSPPCSSAEACRSALSATEAFGSPASVSAAGSGNAPPPVVSVPVVGVKGLSRAQKLARALRACARKPRRSRAVCRARAHRAFGAGISTAAKATARSGR